MSKAILVLPEMPECCLACPLCVNNGELSVRPDWCQLREVPVKLSMNDYDEHVPEDCKKLLEYYNAGFNDCLDKIMGMEE